MFDGKFICTLTAIIIAVLAICNFEKKNTQLVENYGFGHQGGVKSHPSNHNKMSNPGQLRTSTVAMNPATAQMSNMALTQQTSGLASITGPSTESFGFQTPPNFQARLAPRGSVESFGLGSRIRYNMPAAGRTAYPQQENYHNMVQENYGGEMGCPVPPPNFAAAPAPPETDYALPSYKEQQANLAPKKAMVANSAVNNSLPMPVATLSQTATAMGMPMPTMAEVGAAKMVQENYSPGASPGLGGGIASDGDQDNVVPYNNLVLSQSKSRNTGLGCPIRGDVAIPQNNNNCGWFQTSLKPGVDTALGAMQVIAPGGVAAMDQNRLRLNAMQGQPTMGMAGGDVGEFGGPSQAELASVSAVSDVNIALAPGFMP